MAAIPRNNYNYLFTPRGRTKPLKKIPKKGKNPGPGTRQEKETKNCFVLLKRLDKAVLDRHLRKQDSDPESIAKEDRKKEKRRRRSKTKEESSRNDCFKRRKKMRAKPLYYTEDEDEFSSADPKDSISEKTTAADNPSPPLLNKHPKAEIGANHDGTLKQEKASKKTHGIKIETTGLVLETFLEDLPNKTTDAVRQPQSDVRPSEAFSQGAIQNFPEKMDQVGNDDGEDFGLGRVKKEVEAVEELGELGSLKTELKWDEEEPTPPDCGPVEMQELEFEENESRDEGEDDRETVVFERSFDDRDTHFEEVLEKAEERTPSVTKKFHKKKMMNRKKKTLVKFKRKRSIVGRNLAKVRKAKSKDSESRGNVEKESDSERNTGEVCSLVKRLHQLHKIILQLQKELPMDAEQADYFMRIVKAQQENVYKEIKKSEKTIMKGYDKMVSSFGSASAVSLEIGKRTSLSKEDIADVISQCKTETSAAKLQEASPSQSIPMEKSTKEANVFNYPGKNPAPGSGTADLGVTLPIQSVQTSGHHRPPKSLQGPNEPNSPKLVETRRKHSTEHLHGPSNSSRVSQPLQNNNCNQVLWFDVSKPRAHFGPRENFPRRTHVPHRDSRFIRFPQQNPRHVHGNQVRPPLLLRPLHSPNVRAVYAGGGLPVRGGGTPAVSCRPANNNVEFFQISDAFVSPAPLMPEPARRVQPLMEVNPFPFGFPQCRLPPQHFPHVQNPCPIPPGGRPASGPHFDSRPKYGNGPPQTNRIQNNFTHSSKSYNNFPRPNSFPSSKSSECDAPNQTFPKEGQCSLRNLLTSFSRLLQSANPPMQTHLVTQPPANLEQTLQQTNSLSTEPASKSVALESHVLDPTVPQKLTMRNCRLEAGPVLKPKKEEVVTSEEDEKPRREQESASDDGGAEALNQKETNSRVYVCAQYGCKNPGVRICKGCLSIIYCSETCQLKHWTLKHKTECHQLKELRG